MIIQDILLILSPEILLRAGVVGIDALGFEHSYDSKYYRGRVGLTVQQLEIVPLVGEKNATPDIHVKATRKHDSQIALSLIKYNSKNTDILLGDKGYDDQKIRRLTRQYEVRPLINIVSSYRFTRHTGPKSILNSTEGRASPPRTT